MEVLDAAPSATEVTENAIEPTENGTEATMAVHVEGANDRERPTAPTAASATTTGARPTTKSANPTTR